MKRNESLFHNDLLDMLDTTHKELREAMGSRFDYLAKLEADIQSELDRRPPLVLGQSRPFTM